MAAGERIPAGNYRRAASQRGWFAARQEVNANRCLAGLLVGLSLTGCTTTRIAINQPSGSPGSVPVASDESKRTTPHDRQVSKKTDLPDTDGDSNITLTSAEDPSRGPDAEFALPPAPDESAPRPQVPTQVIALQQVVEAIYQSYPLLEVALLDRDVASGANVSSQGEFDFKVKAETANTPEGFYQTYRHGVGFEQPLYGGGNVFGGYRIGRGSFEPWYLERQTNDGGEFKLGLSVPLWQNRAIDERRADLWRTAYGRNLVEPEIRAQLLGFIRDGSIAYWEWVAAGLQNRYAEQLLMLAQNRDAQVRRQVEEGDRPEADLTDNQRLIVSRRVKLLDTRRKLQTTATKLSLYLRMPDGSPFVPTTDLLPESFPEPMPVNPNLLPQDIAFAQSRRPELEAYDVQRQILNVELCQAENLLQPELNGVAVNSQDVGGPTSSKGDKTPYELEAGVYFSVPVQRRKARGKISAIEGKIAQWNAKRQFAAEKISVEVQTAVIALDTAYQAISQARDAVRLNEEMQRFELIRLEQGDSDFLRLNLRETATFDARVTEVEALARYFEAQADYRAAVAADIPEI
jgi:outer membrane protein TolC